MTLLLLLASAFAGDAPFDGYMAPAWALQMNAITERAPALEGRVLDAYHGDFVDPNDLAERLKSARVVVIGEDHENAHHHKAVAKLLYRAVRRDAVVAMRRPGHDRAAVAVERARGRLIRALPPGSLEDHVWSLDPDELPVDYGEFDEPELPGAELVEQVASHIDAETCRELDREEVAHRAGEEALAHAWMARTVRQQKDPVFVLADQIDAHEENGVPSHLGEDVVTVVLYALPKSGEVPGYLEYEDVDYVWFTDGSRRRDACEKG